MPEETGKSNTINSFKAVVDHINKENKGIEKQTASSNKTKKVAAEHSADYIYADPSNWLSSYPELKVSKKAGEIEGMTLYVFKECPLADPKHSNNQNGASLSVTKDGKVKFRCLHESHKELTIFDFAKKYPVPDSANLVRPFEEPVTVEGLEANHRYAYGRFQLTQSGVKMKTEKGHFAFIGNPIFINKLIKNIDTKEIEVEICFFVNDEVETLVLSADILQMNTFKQIAKYGYTFLSNHERDIVDYLNLQKEKLLIDYEHSNIGCFLKETGEISYRSNKVFSSTSTKLSTLSKKSPFDLLPSVDPVTELDEFIESNVLDLDMELALCIGLAVLPHGYLKLTGRKDLSNIMVNFQGKSSTGKTAALKLISSIFGNPSSMVRNFNATNNAIINLASKSSGIPLIFDELGAASTSDLSSLFYQLSLGEEKLRMTTDRQLVEQQKFSLLTLMSSEEHIGCYLENKRDGLLVRQLEFSDVAWTKTAKHAEKIKQFCNNNYGLILENLMNKLFPNNLTSLQEYFEEANAYLSPKLNDHQLKDRICDNLAIIYTGGLLAKRLLNYSINLKRIEKHLITAYDQLIEDNSRNSQSVLQRVQEVIVQNAHKFVDGKGSIKRSFNSIYGKYTITKNGELKVNIFAREFERLLKKEFEVKDISYILKELLDDGSMQTEKGRRTKRVRINKQAMTTYEILLPMELKLYFMEMEQPYTTNGPLFNRTYQETEISEDDLNF